MNNCLCVLSKNVTPWDDYISLLNIGSELDKKQEFEKIIYSLLTLNQKDFNKFLKKMHNYLENKFDEKNEIEKYIMLFHSKKEVK